ncbi:MAG TPA: 50S ribosomal protein L18 [Bacteroidota bacterium]|jgi:large subunit ribosomal protein L18|nr:50S ribosomal protein L18 [Bacteroidota bacterium]
MITNKSQSKRIKKKNRIRKKIQGTPECPRLVVFRSTKHAYAQIVDDLSGKTLLSVSTLSKEVRDEAKTIAKPVERFKFIGKAIAKKAIENNITKVVFDRNGYLYHGRIKALADGAREGGLKF